MAKYQGISQDNYLKIINKILNILFIHSKPLGITPCVLSIRCKPKTGLDLWQTSSQCIIIHTSSSVETSVYSSVWECLASTWYGMSLVTLCHQGERTGHNPSLCTLSSGHCQIHTNSPISQRQMMVLTPTMRQNSSGLTSPCYRDVFAFNWRMKAIWLSRSTFPNLYYIPPQPL